MKLKQLIDLDECPQFLKHCYYNNNNNLDIDLTNFLI
jgi:hypothetical protein